jgi:hypothetical protein
MTRTEYDRIYEATTRKPSSQSQGYDWWKEEKAIVDDEMSLFERKRRVGPPK